MLKCLNVDSWYVITATTTTTTTTVTDDGPILEVNL